MQKRLWGVSAAALALTCLTVTGCGTAQHASPSTGAPETTQITSHQPINVKNNLKNQPVVTLYKNPLFGFEVLYPASWIMGTSPQDGDGRAFFTPSNVSSYNNGGRNRSTRKDVILRTLGVPNATMGVGQGLSFSQMVQKFKDTLPKHSSSAVRETYKVIPNQYIILNVEKNIGYHAMQLERTYISLKADNIISLTFPSSQKRKYLDIWAKIIGSFKFGDTPG